MLLKELLSAKGKIDGHQAQLSQFHEYGSDILADGFVRPIVLPKDRINELKGNSSLLDFSAKSRIAQSDLEFLCEYDNLEPTMNQLVSLSLAHNVSVLWLLGYHTTKERHLGSGDRSILTAVAKRNAAEAARRRIKAGSLLGPTFVSMANRRIQRLNMEIAATAARVIAMEHIPLSDAEIALMAGQPVYLEYKGKEQGEWALSDGTSVLTRKQRLDVTLNGDLFLAYQVPVTLSPL